MKQYILTTILLVTVKKAFASHSDEQLCSRETFTNEELSKPFAYIRNPLFDISGDESQMVN